MNLKNRSLDVSTSNLFCVSPFFRIGEKKHIVKNNISAVQNMLTRIKLVILLIFSIVSIQIAYSQSQTFTSSTTFAVPAGVTSIKVECWGGGGSGGGNGANNSNGGGGGAGGSYASSTITVVPGNTYTVTVGTTRTGTNGAGVKGNPSWFGSASTIYAEGGAGGAAPNGGTVAGVAGSIASSIGDIRYAGGNGASGTSTLGGAGGGGAGSAGAGGSASGTTAGTGTTIGGGNGGAGLTSEANGNAGNTYGGGGSGAYVPDNSNHAGGNGAAGRVVVSYPVITTSITSLTAFSYIFGNGPSSQQSFTVSGVNLFANLIVTAPTNYEISTTSGSGFQSTPITLTQTGGTVATTTIYVRLKAGLAIGNYNLENIAATSTGAAIKNVFCSGTVNNVPLITTTPGLLTGFNYIFGNGPSAQQSFTVSGTYLVANITVTPSTNYEISLTSGSGFQSTPITLTQSGGNVASTTIYVRLKTGLAIGSYNLENIASTSTSAVAKNVSCSGTVGNVPLITTTPTTLTGFSYTFGSGPSAQQSFTVSGTYLVANVTVTPSTNYEISTTSGSGFQSSPIILTQSGGNLSSITIYVRLKAGLAGGNYNLENIASTSTSAVTKNVACSGTVINIPLITTSLSSLTGLNYFLANGPSAQQSFTISGSYLVANIIVTPTTNYEISTTSGSGFQSTPITLTQSGGNVATTTIYVRLKSGLALGSYNSENIASTSTNAVTKNVACSGTVSNVPLITTTPTSLTGFTYIFGNGPSAQQSLTVSGTYLVANISLTPSTNYEISTTSGSGFQSTPITLTQTGGNVASTTIYVRLKAGLAAGNYNSQNIVSTSTSAVTKNVTCNGYVSNAPLITTTPSSLTGFGYTVGYGPSAQQSFTVTGTYLLANITVTPSTNYEISTTSGSGFQSTPITLTQSGGNVATTTIYVRLKTGLSAASYNSENIASTTTLAVTKNVSCSGTVYTPAITTSVSTLTGFIYPLGYGPSSEQSFTVSGSNLIGNVTIVPSTSFEISTGSGASFVASSLITLSVSGGSVATTTIYVRMKSGIAQGTVAEENIVSSSSGATSKNVACSGAVVIAPVISTSATTLSGFSYTFGGGPSAQQSFTVSGTSLIANVTVTPPTNFEISTTSGSGFVSTPIVLTQTGGTLSARTIYTRLKIGLGVGDYSEYAVASSTNATTKNVLMSGTINPSPTIYNAISFLSGFIYTLGGGPSGTQSFVVKASALTADVIATPPAANFEISKDGVNFQSTALTLLKNGTTLTTDTIVYVRMKSGITGVGMYGPLNSSVVLTSAGAITKSIACTGKVVDTKTLVVSKTTLTGFGYEYSASPVGGPSAPQLLIVSGSSLTGDIVITAPTNYEISQNSSSGYSTTITLTGTTVNPTTIYVRLRSGLLAANYGTLAIPQNLTVASSGATTINVACIGKVFASPLISAYGGGSFCEGSTINLTSVGGDIQSFYWTGPNNYYSSSQNPTLSTNATASLSGTYTVNGNVIVGGNLITNGDFEAGNTSFSSGYGYVAPSAAALNPEGLYTIVNLPSAVHGDFTNQPDHTTGSGLQMVVNGSPTAGVVVWGQSVPVIPGATYQFTYSEQTVNITQVPKNASQLQLYVNGVAAGPVYTAPLVNYQWATFVYNATAGTNTVLNLELINQNTIAAGNDFALDDIIFQQILPATSSTNVTVNPIVPVSVSVVASANPVYSNTPVTFTATPTNGGTTPTYQWKVNGLNVGTNSTTYVYTPLEGDSVSCTLISSLTCVTNNPASAYVIMSVTHRINYWMGYIDTDWGKSGNWTDNFVPLTGDDVEYATVANFGISAMRDLHLDIDRTIGSLINATTKRLVIPAGKGLTVNNTVNTDGNADRIYIYSSSTVANGSLSFKNIESMPVSATVEMYSKASFDTKQAVNNKFKWQYFGVPIQSVVANPTLSSGLDSTYVRKWYETGTTIQNHWIELSNDSVLKPFYGYEICQKKPRTYYFKGQLVNRDFNSGQLAITPTALYPGQHVFANPYTAAIDIRQLTFGIGTQATVYLYNTGTFAIWENDGGYTSGTNEGQYVAIPNYLAGATGLPRQVPSMQAMLIKAQDLTSEAYFGINYNAVIMNNTDLQRVKDVEDESDKVCTRIDVKGKHFSDKMWIFTEPGCSNSFDNGWDGFKFLGSSVSPQIFAKESDGDYQVTTVGDMNNSNIYFQAGEDIEYTLTFTHTNLKKKYQGVYLVDLVENRTVEITETGTEYKFSTVSTPKALNRFIIVTRPYEESSADLNSLVKIFTAGKTVFIHNFSNVDGELTIYDISGRSMKKGTFIANGVTAINTNYISGGYIVRVKTSLEEISKRIILR